MERSLSTDVPIGQIIYQIYPKSFFDYDGDGVGDIKGIILKLPYFVSLGVDTIVLSSVLETGSEGTLFGTTDFCRINPAVGSMEDLDELIIKAHEASIKVFLSFPISCTSSSHPWFEKSKASTTLNPYREYYIWKPGKTEKGKAAPDKHTTRFKTPLWAYDKSGEWYRCYYTEKYPELNFDNPRVRREILEVFRFWQQKNLDGIFIESVRFTTTKRLLKDQKTAYKIDENFFDDGKGIYRILRDHKETDAPFVVVLKEEATDEGIFPYLTCNDKPVADAVAPETLIAPNRVINPSNFSLKDFIKNYLSLQESPVSSHITLGFEDKDHSRLISKIVNTSGTDFLPAAKFLATLLFCSVATPMLYQGEEIGMTDFQLSSSEQRADIDPALYHTRSPFQWDSNPMAAFTTAEFSCLPINANYHKINLLTQASDPNSIFAFYRKLIGLRKSSSALSNGSFKNYSKGDLVCFLRESQTERLLVIANPTAKHQNARTPAALLTENARCEVCNYDIVSKTLNATMGLRPYEVRIFRLKAHLLALN